MSLNCFKPNPDKPEQKNFYHGGTAKVGASKRGTEKVKDEGLFEKLLAFVFGLLRASVSPCLRGELLFLGLTRR